MGLLKGSRLSSQHPKAGRKGADSKPECFSLQTAHRESCGNLPLTCSLPSALETVATVIFRGIH